MSYIPDYRHEVEKLSKEDRLYVCGYRNAIGDMRSALDNIEFDAELGIEREIIAKARVELERLMECGERELVCGLFENAAYLPDDIELTDARRGKPFFFGSEEGEE